MADSNCRPPPCEDVQPSKFLHRFVSSCFRLSAYKECFYCLRQRETENDESMVTIVTKIGAPATVDVNRVYLTSSNFPHFQPQ